MRRVVALLIVVLVGAAGTRPASARWATPGTGSGRAVAHPQLLAPTITASCGLLLSEVVVAWTPPPAMPAITRYRVEWGTSASTPNRSIDVLGGATSTTIGGLGIGVFYFRVRSMASSWLSAPSNQPSRTVVGALGIPVACL